MIGRGIGCRRDQLMPRCSSNHHGVADACTATGLPEAGDNRRATHRLSRSHLSRVVAPRDTSAPRRRPATQNEAFAFSPHAKVELHNEDALRVAEDPDYGSRDGTLCPASMGPRLFTAGNAA